MNTENKLLKQLKSSPDSVLVLDEFREYLKVEGGKRTKFYDLVHEDMKAEFINGEIVMHSPVRRSHWQVSNRIAYFMNHFLMENPLGEIGSEKVMIQLTRNSYEPDIVYFKKEVASQFTDEQKLFPTPNLIVEILSKSTQKNDYGVKFKDYEAHGVAEYWIVDSEKHTIEQFVLKEGNYELVTKLNQNGKLICSEIKGFVLDLEKIFDIKA